MEAYLPEQYVKVAGVLIIIFGAIFVGLGIAFNCYVLTIAKRFVMDQIELFAKGEEIIQESKVVYVNIMNSEAISREEKSVMGSQNKFESNDKKDLREQL